METTPSVRRRWTVSATGRVSAGAAAGGLALMAVLDTVAHDRSISSVVPLVLGLAVAWWLLTLRPAIFIRGDQLVVRNAFWSRRLLRDEVTSVTPGYCGLVVRCREGRGCTAWAVQKSNWSTWNGRVRRADRVAAEIMRWARRD